MAESFSIELPSPQSAVVLTGYQGENLKALGRESGAQVVLRGQELVLSGSTDQIQLCHRLVQLLADFWKAGKTIDRVDIFTAHQAIKTDREQDLQALHRDVLARTRRGDEIRAKTFQQQDYIQAVRTQDLTFCLGPAGTGKTFLAAVLAVQAFLANQYERLVLTRPAVEAGEKLGFLPGDLQQKVNPYLRPLYDALYEFIEPEKVAGLMERGVIEVAPIAYMRGRTLSNSFVILDEAQNTTPAQMKMILTRLGFRSRMVVTGDLTQTDLPTNQGSGLAVAYKILRQVQGISFCQLSQADVVRHPLVQRIVTAYERHEAQNPG